MDDNWRSVFLDDLTIDPEKEAGEEDSDDEIEDDSAEQVIAIIQRSYCGPS